MKLFIHAAALLALLALPLADNANAQFGFGGGGVRVGVGPGGVHVGTGRVGVAVHNGQVHVGTHGWHGYGPGHRYGLPGYYHPHQSGVWYGTGWRHWGNDYDEQNGQSDTLHTPPLPSDDEWTRMTWQQLHRAMAFAATRLENELDNIDSGENWQRHLRLSTLQKIANEQRDEAPTDKEQTEIVRLLKTFDATAANDSYSAINQLWGFRASRAALQQFATSSEDRDVQRLASWATALDRRLTKMRGGTAWRTHLRLPREIFRPSPNFVTAGPEVPEALEESLARFDRIGSNAQFKSIGDLEEFKATREALKTVVSRFATLPPPPTEF